VVALLNDARRAPSVLWRAIDLHCTQAIPLILPPLHFVSLILNSYNLVFRMGLTKRISFKTNKMSWVNKITFSSVPFQHHWQVSCFSVTFHYLLIAASHPHPTPSYLAFRCVTQLFYPCAKKGYRYAYVLYVSAVNAAIVQAGFSFITNKDPVLTVINHSSACCSVLSIAALVSVHQF
jgi:hypothetical protein